MPGCRATPLSATRNVEMRFSMREALTLHEALRLQRIQAEKDGWYAAKTGDAAEAARRDEQAREYADLSDRIFAVLNGMMDLPKKV